MWGSCHCSEQFNFWKYFNGCLHKLVPVTYSQGGSERENASMFSLPTRPYACLKRNGPRRYGLIDYSPFNVIFGRLDNYLVYNAKSDLLSNLTGSQNFNQYSAHMWHYCRLTLTVGAGPVPWPMLHPQGTLPGELPRTSVRSNQPRQKFDACGKLWCMLPTSGDVMMSQSRSISWRSPN
jgi:hypothetical protein